MEELLDLDPENEEITDRQVVEHAPPVTDRSVARRNAIQILYELDTTNHQVGTVLTNHLEENDLDSYTTDYVRFLVTGVADRTDEFDEILQAYAPEFPIDQIAVIDRNALRIAMLELGVDDRIPVKVVVEEAIQLAKLYGAEGSARFVNGVLGAVIADLDTVRDWLQDDEADEQDNSIDPE